MHQERITIQIPQWSQLFDQYEAMEKGALEMPYLD
jgi:hypothetical protein